MFLSFIIIIIRILDTATAKALEKKSVEIMENSMSVWPDVFHILMNVVLPIVIFVSVYYMLFKYYKVAKEISTSLRRISEKYSNNNED